MIIFIHCLLHITTETKVSDWRKKKHIFILYLMKKGTWTFPSTDCTTVWSRSTLLITMHCKYFSVLHLYCLFILMQPLKNPKVLYQQKKAKTKNWKKNAFQTLCFVFYYMCLHCVFMYYMYSMSGCGQSSVLCISGLKLNPDPVLETLLTPNKSF